VRSTILGQGRHRLGLPGLIPVRHFVAVTQRSFLARLFGIGARPGRHHLRDDAATRAVPALQTAAA
jgi:hypothetical protein